MSTSSPHTLVRVHRQSKHQRIFQASSAGSCTARTAIKLRSRPHRTATAPLTLQMHTPATTEPPPAGALVTPPNAANGTPAPASASMIPPPLVSSSAVSANTSSPKKQTPFVKPPHQQQQPQFQRGSGFVDVLRSMGSLTVSNAYDIREELRFLRRRRGKQEEAIVLSELAALASCLNELVVSTMTSNSGTGNPVGSSGSSGSSEEGGNKGEVGNKAGGGAVAVEPSRRSLVGMLSYEGLLPAFQHTAVPAPMAVLGDAALLHYCLEFLVEGRLEHRKQLGELALVCRQWRDLAQSERFWRPIVLQLFPRLSPTALDHDEEDPAAAGAASTTDASATVAGVEANVAVAELGGGATGGVNDQTGPQAMVPDWYRKYLIQFGRCLFDRPVRQGPWHEGITLSFDLHDEQDGIRLFSSTGPIRFTGTTIPGITAMKLTGRRRRVTAPFSAASRDRKLGALTSIEELFQEGDSGEYSVAFTIRVTARDERTGKMALLFSSGKRTKRWVEPLGEDMGVPQGTLLVNQGWSRVTIPSTDLAMQMLTVFYVAPVEGQPETVDPAERLYSVLPLDCAFMLQCKTEDQEQIGRFIQAALENGPSLECDS